MRASCPHPTWPWFSARHGYDFNGWLVASLRELCIDRRRDVDRGAREISYRGVGRVLLTNRITSAPACGEGTHRGAHRHPSQGAAFARERGPRSMTSCASASRVGRSPSSMLTEVPRGDCASTGRRGASCSSATRAWEKPPGECALLPDGVIDDKPALIESLRRLAGWSSIRSSSATAAGVGRRTGAGRWQRLMGGHSSPERTGSSHLLSARGRTVVPPPQPLCLAICRAPPAACATALCASEPRWSAADKSSDSIHGAV